MMVRTKPFLRCPYSFTRHAEKGFVTKAVLYRAKVTSALVCRVGLFLFFDFPVFVF